MIDFTKRKTQTVDGLEPVSTMRTAIFDSSSSPVFVVPGGKPQAIRPGTARPWGIVAGQAVVDARVGHVRTGAEEVRAMSGRAVLRRTAGVVVAIGLLLPAGAASAEDDPAPVDWPEVQQPAGTGSDDPVPVKWPEPVQL